ncbi:hypothetical protein JN11_00137 [Mucilaginibacter frigoritolerans]|uniref:Lipoprotein n=1 Tax=Mucilaginibacter frigoritolerans TaxID=652788 RepID=A0A562UF61_9SPHI|nr:hypothetical protein [Mucilaginibacter frigoritolerans]TWJ04428.1 hypothetical protein JN11_00137 [Mucilaginibacter frigoritolerans]
MNLTKKSYLQIAFIIFIISTITACKSQNSQQSKSILKEEIKAKKGIDKLANDSNAVIVLIKKPGSDSLQLIKDGKFPDDVEVTYNLVKDKNGNIVLISESPTSESGDWDIQYLNYFNKSGKLFAFERMAGFFNSECTIDADDAAHEDLVKYYDTDFNVISSKYTLTDSKHRKLKKSKCQFNYDYPYIIAKDLKTYLKTNHINI